MKEFKGPLRSVNFNRSLSATQQMESERNIKKIEILSALQALVDAEKVKNPAFDISMKFVDKFIKENRKLFPNVIKAGSMITGYFTSIGFLKVKLGLLTEEEFERRERIRNS